MTQEPQRARVLPQLAAFAAALCAGATLAAHAAEPLTQPAETTATRAAQPQPETAQPSRRAVRDPQTGALIDGPLPGAAAPQARSARSVAPAAPAKPEEMNELMLQFMQRTQPQPGRAGDARSLSLTPRHLSSSVVKRTPDGRLVSQCVTGETEAEHRLHAPAVDLQGLKGARHDR